MLLKPFPKFRQKLDRVGAEFHLLEENFNYEFESNGEQWLLQRLAEKGLLGTVLDVGANHGDWAAEVLKVNPNATIHCFEICPPTFQKLSKNLPAKKGKLFLNAFGLSDAPGEIKIRYCPDSDGVTTMFDVVLSSQSETVDAKVARGKDYCVEHGINSVDFLKLDVEGAEHLVLKGFDDLLVPEKVRVVQFEYGLVNILTKFLLRDFYQLFEERGYKVGKLFPNSMRFRKYQFQDEDFRGPNYVAISPQLANLFLQEGQM